MNKTDHFKNNVPSSCIKLDSMALLTRMLEGPDSHTRTSPLSFVHVLVFTGWRVACLFATAQEKQSSPNFYL